MTFSLKIEETLSQLLAREDTDGDKKITIEDNGPKAFVLVNSDGDEYSLKGTYHLSNLLQELVIARNEGKTQVDIPIEKLEELPVTRISRMIREYYWNGLTRTMDEAGIVQLLADSKNESLEELSVLNVYVPAGDRKAYDYYKQMEGRHPLKVVQLPEDITPEYVRSINKAPGILSLKLSEENSKIKGLPFVVPGGRFNEMYGWDSYFEAVGLLLDERVDLAKAMAEHFQYEIEHYGKILNANRSYYLTRTQPPFYSSMISEIYEREGDQDWLKEQLKTAIKEYESVWMVPGKRLTDIGLNRYLAEGLGMPPEAETGHFDHVFGPEAKKAGMEMKEYMDAYNNGRIKNEALDEYFIHDRSVRESGHDTSYRLEGICADIIPVELNAFLYKYEMDFARLIREECNDSFKIGEKEYSSSYWLNLAETRRKLMNRHLWNEEKGVFFDYNLDTASQHEFISATMLAPLWAGACGIDQAEKLVPNAMKLLKEQGGIASCDEHSRGPIGPGRPQKQWDYPNGWAPHQMMIWKGLMNYGFNDELQELLYRWLYMITRNAVDYNGTIPEKYDVVSATHKVFAEYGNVGTEFEYITTEGFGWMNASYQFGISLLKEELLVELNQLTPPSELF